MSKLTTYPALPSAAASDLLPIVDVDAADSKIR